MQMGIDCEETGISFARIELGKRLQLAKEKPCTNSTPSQNPEALPPPAGAFPSVAQLAARLILNQRVGGSRPIRRETMIADMMMPLTMTTATMPRQYEFAERCDFESTRFVDG